MKCLKKLLLLFLLLFICMFCIVPLNNNAFASSNIIFKYKDHDYSLNYSSVFDGKAYLINYNSYYNCFIAYVLQDTDIYMPKGYKLVKYSDNRLKFMSSDNSTYFDTRHKCYKYLNNAWEHSSTNDDGDTLDFKYFPNGANSDFLYSNYNIYNNDGSLLLDGVVQSVNPHIVNSLDSLSTWKFDNLWIDYGDYDINKTIYLHICKKTVDVSGSSSFYYTDSVIALSTDGKYYESYENGQVYYFSIPKDNLPFTVSSGDKIIFYLSSSASNLGGSYSSDSPIVDASIFDTKSFTVGSSYTDEDKQKDYQDKISSSLEDQKQAIEENTKTNKNIFEKIGDILSYIKPFSENFFGKKLVELILDGLKGLFVPEDGFFDTYFSDLKDWFSDRLGFLWTPFDIIIEILNKILNINFSEPIFHIPEINEPFSGSKLISEYDYNLNSLLDNDIFKNIHDIYFIGVDAVIIFALINLARRKIEEVFSN